MQQLFEEMFPLTKNKTHGVYTRGHKPFLCNCLGSLVADINKPILLENHSYYKIDALDFLDFATSGLNRRPVLRDFTDGEAQFFEFSNSDEDAAAIEESQSGSPFAVSLLDAVVARVNIFVSVTVRIAYRRSEKEIDANTDTNEKGWVVDLGKRIEEIVSITYAPHMHNADTRAPDDCPLTEWDRYVITVPIPSAPEWTFRLIDGVYTSAMIEETKRDPSKQDFLCTALRIEKAYGNGVNLTKTQLELARLCIGLPSYGV